MDAGIVQKKVDELVSECSELFQGGKADPKYVASDIAEINRKLELLLERVNGTDGSEVPITQDGCGRRCDWSTTSIGWLGLIIETSDRRG